MSAPLPQASAAAAGRLEAAPLPEVLAWVEESFGAGAALAVSFSVEDTVVIHAARAAAPSLRFFALDTGRLAPETYEVAEQLERRLGVRFETFFPERAAVEAYTLAHGHFGFRESLELRKQCCALRKLEPLGRALQGRAAWLTGLRRDQAGTRAGIQVLEHDAEHGLAKVNPLAAWTEAQVWAYVREHGLPYCSLYDQGYRSIGCAPCTRAVKPSEDARAGRWWWESPEHKECGLHLKGGR